MEINKASDSAHKAIDKIASAAPSRRMLSRLLGSGRE
jgi:hypothetical protein